MRLPWSPGAPQASPHATASRLAPPAEKRHHAVV